MRWTTRGLWALPFVLALSLPLICAEPASPVKRELRDDAAAPLEARQDNNNGGNSGSNGNNLPALLTLASQAGIPLPTNDPALLLSLGPAAAQLASLLPTAPVLSVLQTAAPSGFVSQIVHNPSYAMSFEAAFAAGSSPSWFTALPSSVKSYLHTYANYGGIASAAATALSQVNSIENAASTAVAGSNSSMSTMSTASANSSSSMSSTGGMSTSAPSNGASTSSQASSTSKADAARETGALAIGALAAVGMLGIAVAL